MTVRILLKNPILYYILAPILVGLWPLLVWRIYLPRAQRALDTEQNQYVNGETSMLDILTLDPGRLVEGAGSPASSGKFNYPEAVSRVADRCQIPSRNKYYDAGNITKISGKDIQGAKVTLSSVGIVQACSFLSTIQSMWVNLECESAKLTKQDPAPDSWNVDLSFKYTY
jgi:hypothetical protein